MSVFENCGDERTIGLMFVGALLSREGGIISTINKHNVDGIAGI
jgi:hypothetical protein